MSLRCVSELAAKAGECAHSGLVEELDRDTDRACHFGGEFVIAVACILRAAVALDE